MITLSNLTAQTLAPGQALVFDDVILHSGCGECHRKNTGSVKLRANGVYIVNYGANVSSATAGAPVQLSLQIGGATLPETTAISTPSTANVANNLFRETQLKNCCGDYDRVTLVNTGTNPVTVGARAVLNIRRAS